MSYASIGGSAAAQYIGEQAAKRQADVDGWLVSLGYSTERLAAIAADLESRLGPALSLAMVSPAGTGAPNDPARCALSSRIQTEVERLDVVEAVLREILRRLEI